MIGNYAHRNNVFVVTGEFGGGSTVNLEGLAVVENGIRSVSLASESPRPGDDAAPRRGNTRRLIMDDPGLYACSPRRGLFEPKFALGDEVKDEAIAGLICDLDNPWADPGQRPSALPRRGRRHEHHGEDRRPHSHAALERLDLTRDPPRQRARHPGRLGMRAAEEPIDIANVMAAGRSGGLEEMWGVGTAAVVSPVGELSYRGETITINGGRTGPIAQRLFDELIGLHYGTRPDTREGQKLHRARTKSQRRVPEARR